MELVGNVKHCLRKQLTSTTATLINKSEISGCQLCLKLGMIVWEFGQSL